MKMDYFTLLWALATKKGGVMCAGFFGALVSLKWAEGLTVKSGAVTISFGVILAQFLSESLAKRFDVMEYVLTVAFLVGLFGLSFCATVIKAFKDADLWSLIKSKWDSWSTK